MHTSRWLLMVLLAIVGFTSVPAVAQQFGESVTRRGPVNEDLYLAGGRVMVAAQVRGDVTAAGARVTIEDTVEGDVLAFGGSVELRARVRDDARIGGGEVSVRGRIGDDLLAAGGTVYIAPETVISGRAWLAGGELEIAGRIGKELRAAGGEIVISGEVRGDAELIGENIVLRPDARILGQLTYRSPNPLQVDEGATVQGTVNRQPFEFRHPERGHGGARLFIFVSLFTAAAVLWLLFPRFASSAAQGIGTAPWPSIGIGFAVLAGGPLLAVALLASVIGVWLGLLMLIVYLALLLLGYLTGILFVAETALRRWRPAPATRGWTLGAIAATLVVVMLLRLIPVVGGLITFALLLFGLGALARALWSGYRGTPARAPARRPRKKRTAAR